MSDDKIIAVVGATGMQGGGLARAILGGAGSGFKLRALTRNPGADAAQALQAAGAEVVTADLDDEASLLAAFTGAYGAFCVTNFWEHFSPAKEYEQAGRMARAAAQAGLSHVIWSTLEDTRRFIPLDDDRMPTLQDRYKVPHYDAKGEANELFAKEGVPTTFLQPAFYWDNMINFGMGPKRDTEGQLVLTFPLGDAKLPGIAGGDVGGCAYGIFSRGADTVGKTFRVAGALLSGAEMADHLSQAVAEPVRYQSVSADAYRGFGFPGAEDLGNMFQAIVEFPAPFGSEEEVAASRSLNPGLLTFDGWLAQNATKIPLD